MPLLAVDVHVGQEVVRVIRSDLGTLAVRSLLVAWVCVSPLVGWAQPATSTLSGTVVDQSGGALPSVSLTLIHVETALERSATADDAGVFSFPVIPPGRYVLRAHREGFAPTQFDNVVLNVGDHLRLSVTLKVGTITDAVTVVADTRRMSPGLATVVGSEFVERQPMNGRSFQTLIELSPGAVIVPTNVTTGGTFSVNGQRTGSNGFSVDGVSANFGAAASFTPYQTAGGGLPSLSAQGGTNTLASVDAVQEFAIETHGYAPEFGRQSGGQISIVTRSGGNQLRGSVFDFWRDTDLEAKDYFARRANLPKPELRLHNFGATLGGPIVRGRAFFFASYEGLRLSQPVTSPPFIVPSIAAREVATGRIADILRAFPLPTSEDPDDPDGGFFVASYTNPSSLDAVSVRLDTRFGTDWSVFGRYNRAPSEIQERAYFATPNTISFREHLTETITGGATWARNALTNDLRLNFSRATAGDRYEIDDFGGAIVPPTSALLPPYGDPARDLGLLYIGGDSGLTLGRNSTNRQRQFQVVNTTSFVHGPHHIKVGVDYRRLTPITASTGQWNGGFFFDTPTDASNGLMSFFYASVTTERLEPVYDNFSLFAQDSWTFPRLSLTYGLRWDVSPAPTDASGHLPYTVTGLDSPEGPQLAPPNTTYYRTSWTDFAPRFGATYQLLPDRGLLLKAGVGLFYDLPYAFTGSALLGGAYPYGSVTVASPLLLTDPLVDAALPPVTIAPPYGDVTAYEAGYRTPRTTQWHAGIEQSLRGNGSLAVAYVGSAGRRLGRVESVRNATPDFPRIDIVRNAARSDYHALQAAVRYRAVAMQLSASYTVASAEDTVSNESISNFQAPAGTYDPERDRGPSDFDVRHAFAAAVNYTVPTGVFRSVSIDGFLRARSALPVNITVGRDPFGYGSTTITRPDVVAGVPLVVDDESAPGGRRINAAAFVEPPDGQHGNLGRNAVRGFSAWQLDVSLSRPIAIGGLWQLILRVDAFNLFNRVNLANPSGDLANPNFGVATQTLNWGLGGLNPVYQLGGPRSVQLSARLRF
jgi:hypothetical protein